MGLMMGNTTETPNSKNVSTKRNQIAELARKMPGVGLRTLAHHIDIDWLREAYAGTRKDGAPGIDEVTAEEPPTETAPETEALRAKMQSLAPINAAEERAATRPVVLPSTEEKSCGTRWMTRKVIQYVDVPVPIAVGGVLETPAA